MSTEPLSQLNALIADAEANQVDADKWHTLVALISDMGYGPRIMPQQIADLLPNVHGINEIAGYSKEVVPAQPAGSKMPRRKLTSEDERVITARSDAGCPAAQIAEDLGIAQKIVRDFLDRTHA